MDKLSTAKTKIVLGNVCLSINQKTLAYEELKLEIKKPAEAG